MKVLKILIVAAALLTAFTPLWTQPNVETLNVDTLCYLGKNVAGEAGGALFLPDGNIIAFWKSIPHLIDSKTGEVIRRMDTVHSELLNRPRLTTNGLRLGGISMGPKLNIWDVPSGKIIFQTEKKIIDYCFSPDGTKLFVTLPNNSDNPGNIAIYDMATFTEIERLSHSELTWAGQIDISPDGQTLAVSVSKTPANEYDKMTNPFILINLNDKKNYYTVETFKSGIRSMEFSPDGKQIAFMFDGGTEQFIYIYNLVSKEKKRITKQELSALFGNIGIAALGKPFFVDSNTILFDLIGSLDKNYWFLDWNISENRIKYYINSKNNYSVNVRENTILLCNQRALIGFLDKTIVPIKEMIVQTENYITFHNNQLEFNSASAFFGETSIFDTTGKLITNLGTLPYIIGKNLIKINQPLLRGVYILTINDTTNQSSYKFIVE